MNNFYKLSPVALFIALTACQSSPIQYNGVTGYQVEYKAENSATIAYTLSARSSQEINQQKLLRTCQKVLGSNQAFKVNILSVSEIANPAYQSNDLQQIKIGNSRTSFGLSNTQNVTSDENYAAREALNNKPSVLQVVRYSCSL